MSAREDLAAFLDSISAWYPGGVPLELISDAELDAPALTKVKILFVASGDSGGTDVWDGEEGDLLAKAVTNGLKLPLGSVRLVRGDTGTGPSGWRSEIESARPRVVVALGQVAAEEISGQRLERGQWSEIGQSKLVCTHSLADVLREQSLKRAFWGDLQMVIQELGQP